MRTHINVFRAAAAVALVAPSFSHALGDGADETMAARLRALAQLENPYRNDLNVARLRELERAAPEPLGRRFHVELAQQLLRAGQTEQAIVELEALRAAASDDLVRRAFERQLAVAYLRLGEQRNCQANHGPDSCLLPIRGGGVHVDEEGSRRAIVLLTGLLEESPRSMSLRWLLNLAHMTLGSHPDGVPEQWRIAPEVFDSDAALPRFVDVAPATGVAHFAQSGGVVLDDLDGDDDLDLLVSSWGTADPLRLYRNEGDGTFTDVSEEAGLAGQLGGLNLSQADYDNDGDVDVFVLRGAWLGEQGLHPNSLLRNRGDGTFEDVTVEAGVLSLHPSSCAAWNDFDGDGLVDLFVANESRLSLHPCELYRNLGDGTFRDVAPEVGLDHVGFVKGAAWGDYDADGRPDLYLSRFGAENRLYRNLGAAPADDADLSFRWRFADVTAAAGVGEPRRSFATWFFDHDGDGRLDLLVASFAGFGGSGLEEVVADMLGVDTRTSPEYPRLFRNRGDGTFEDVTAEAGLRRVVQAMGANFGDLDNDGWLDVYFGTGDPDYQTLVPNRMFRNDRGRGFQDVTTAGGFGNLQKGHGIAFGDIDNDGDQDVYAVLGGAYSGDVYPNALFLNPGNDHRWLTLQLRGTRANRLAIGTRVRVVVEDGAGERRTLHRVVGSGGSFGASSLQLELGLGDARRVLAVEVDWAGSGTHSRYVDVPLDRVLRLVEGDEEVRVVEVAPIPLRTGVTEHAHGGHGR